MIHKRCQNIMIDPGSQPLAVSSVGYVDADDDVLPDTRLTFEYEPEVALLRQKITIYNEWIHTCK